VTRFHGNAWAAVVELVEAAVARQQGKRVCAGQQHATVGRAVRSVYIRRGVIYEGFSRQRGRLRKKNKVIVRRKKKSKIKSGQGSQREARYPDEGRLSVGRKINSNSTGVPAKNKSCLRYNWATLFLEDINTRTWPI
jgi:hypothetical protein